MDFHKLSDVPGSKFMYVKQNLINSIQQNAQPKVLINPHFVQVALVKPHFNKQFLLKQKIHVNPNMLKQPQCLQTEVPKPKPVLNNSVPNKTIVATPTKLIRIPQKHTYSPSSVVLQTRTKLVRISKPATTIETGCARQTSIHTKYKIIRDPTAIQKRETDIKKLYYVRNRFRIDHRSPKKPVSSQKLIRCSLVNKSFNSKLMTKNVYVKCNSKLNKTQFVSINGILYKRSSKSLITVDKKIRTDKLNVKRKCKEQLLTIRGQKYKLDSNHRTLTLLRKNDDKLQSNFKTICVGRVTFKQKEPNVFVKTNVSQKLLSQARQRSIHTLTNKLKKSNLPCPFYRRFGKCKGKESGTCIRIHNPDQVSLCPKFLQGACINSKCLLSHKVSAEKMPTCRFFLEGLCSKDDCPYLHVKINAKADICKDFVEGFCKKAAECDKRHQYLCPEFEKKGSCAKRKCQYPHGALAVMRYKNTSNIKNHPVFDRKAACSKTNSKPLPDAAEKALNVRYYDESTPGAPQKVLNVQAKDESGSVEIVDLDIEQGEAGFVSPLKKRPTVGKLPSFIPF